MKQRPLVSAVIPVHNRSWCLRRAFDSVLNQTYRPLELIIVDDGSTDETPEILEYIDTQYPLGGSLRERPGDSEPLERPQPFSPVVSFTTRILHQKNRGVSAARNAAIQIARGELIALLDSDDEWKPEKTARQVEAFKAEPDLMINQTDEDWIRDGEFVNKPKRLRKTSGDLFEVSLDHCAVSPSAVMMRRKLFDEIGLFDEAYPACEDYEMWLRVTARYPVGLIDEPLLIKYGGHDDQLSRTVEALDRYRIAAIVKTLDSDILSAEQTRLAIDALEEKCRIYALGARKRGREKEADEIEALARQYQQKFLQK